MERRSIRPMGRASYLFNSTIDGIEDADAILLVGTNPRHEAPILNARIRKAGAPSRPIGLIGEAVDLTYDYTHFGDSVDALAKLADHAPPKPNVR
jgi:NADH-quinone oxidoreductase subunit G